MAHIHNDWENKNAQFIIIFFPVYASLWLDVGHVNPLKSFVYSFTSSSFFHKIRQKNPRKMIIFLAKLIFGADKQNKNHIKRQCIFLTFCFCTNMQCVFSLLLLSMHFIQMIMAVEKAIVLYNWCRDILRKK